MTGENDCTVTVIYDRAAYRDDKRQALEVLADTLEADAEQAATRLRVKER
ncbi:MAG: hypothetical protein ACU0B1_15770 [Thermohalobaculum sp.]